MHLTAPIFACADPVAVPHRSTHIDVESLVAGSGGNSIEFGSEWAIRSIPSIAGRAIPFAAGFGSPLDSLLEQAAERWPLY